MTVTGPMVIYRSRGNCLVIGNEEVILPLLQPEWWPEGIAPYLLVNGTVSMELEEKCDLMKISWMRGKAIAVHGHLGNFEITIAKDGDPNGVSLFSTFDLVLDLSRPPLLRREVLPFGYFAPAREEVSHTVKQLAEWVGEFEKPRYFDYSQELCVHGGKHHRGCQSCLEACPAEAVVSVAERHIEIDPYLCQGCGDCVAVCPTGALDYRQPNRQQMAESILTKVSTAPGTDVLIHGIGTSIPSFHRCDGWTVHPVPSVSACGAEIWLTAIAGGARRIRLSPEGLPAKSRANLQKQMAWVNTLLDALGYGKDRIGWLAEETSLNEEERVSLLPGRFAPVRDKRAMLELALAHLLGQRSDEPPTVIPLPPGSPFGAVEVKDQRCTLCLACASICPSQALQAGGPIPRLSLVEQNCVQCGLCVEVCPEDAMRLSPRWITIGEQRRQVRLLCEEPPFTCLECGKPFASRRTIDVVLSRIGSHPLFADERSKRRLLLCEDCRIRDLLRDYES